MSESNPNPDRSNSEAFYDERWEQCGDMKQYGPSSRHTRELIFDRLDGLDFSTLIDIGCGDGTFLSEAAERYESTQLYGTDISEESLHLAQNRTDATVFQMDLGTESVEEAETIDRRFDVGVCSEVLEHIEDDRPALRTIRNMCDQVVFTVPAGEYRDDDEQVGHYRRYSRSEFRNKVEDAGFEIVSIRNWGFPFYSPCYRLMIQNTSDEMRSGEYGTTRKAVSELIYYAFKLNVFDKGDRLLTHAR